LAVAERDHFPGSGLRGAKANQKSDVPRINYPSIAPPITAAQLKRVKQEFDIDTTSDLPGTSMGVELPESLLTMRLPIALSRIPDWGMQTLQAP
jgi:hypothetical protein